MNLCPIYDKIKLGKGTHKNDIVIKFWYIERNGPLYEFVVMLFGFTNIPHPHEQYFLGMTQ
jgi:hypothetical protein